MLSRVIRGDRGMLGDPEQSRAIPGYKGDTAHGSGGDSSYLEFPYQSC